MPATHQPPGSVLAGSIDAFQQSVGHAVLGSFCAALENWRFYVRDQKEENGHRVSSSTAGKALHWPGKALSLRRIPRVTRPLRAALVMSWTTRWCEELITDWPSTWMISSFFRSRPSRSAEPPGTMWPTDTWKTRSKVSAPTAVPQYTASLKMIACLFIHNIVTHLTLSVLLSEFIFNLVDSN